MGDHNFQYNDEKEAKLSSATSSEDKACYRTDKRTKKSKSFKTFINTDHSETDSIQILYEMLPFESVNIQLLFSKQQ